MIDQPVPLDQGRTGLVENGPGYQANLKTAQLAVEYIPRSNEPSFAVSASGASKAVRPFHFSQVLNTRPLGAKGLLKLEQAPFLIIFGCHPVHLEDCMVHRHYELSQ
jgi:hypothetical protein